VIFFNESAGFFKRTFAIAITKEEIYELFDRTMQIQERGMKETEELRRIVRENAEESRRREVELDRRMLENERLMQEIQLQMQDTDLRQKETDRQIKETYVQMKETDRKVKEMTKSIGQLGNRLGQFVEEMVKPAVVRLFRERGIDVHHVFPRASASYEDDAMEVDLLVVNVETAILVETKSDLKADDMREHLDRLGRFKKLFPAFQNHRVMGAVAAMVVSDETARFAYRQGLFVLGQSGEAMVLRNGVEFEPRIW
jgi:hypothetical protein